MIVLNATNNFVERSHSLNTFIVSMTIDRLQREKRAKVRDMLDRVSHP